VIPEGDFEVQRWRYGIAYVRRKILKQGNAFGAHDEWEYVLTTNREFTLADGLRFMGEAGFELVAIQPVALPAGGPVSGWYFPDYYYIFKRPILGNDSEESTSPPY